MQQFYTQGLISARVCPLVCFGEIEITPDSRLLYRSYAYCLNILYSMPVKLNVRPSSCTTPTVVILFLLFLATTVVIGQGHFCRSVVPEKAETNGPWMINILCSRSQVPRYRQTWCTSVLLSESAVSVLLPSRSPDKVILPY
jgi:hypothetical protein